MINVVVAGASGRMGQLIIKQIEKSSDMKLAGVADIDAPLFEVIGKADVVIDFTTPDASSRHAALAAEHGKPLVIGTTGLDEQQKKVVKKASELIPLIHAPNMSVGVNVLFHLIRSASRVLGDEFGVEISETHHVKKLDSPSGTAVKMRDIVAEERAIEAGKIRVNSIREGDVVGDHSITFTGPEEILELKHSALNRELFARGAVVAARWIIDKQPGLYDMSDVLGLV
jgi:4-hydroxy-tetrahydrodipicolinate reductase